MRATARAELHGATTGRAAAPVHALPGYAGPARAPAGVIGDELAWRLDRFNKFLLAASPVARMTAGIAREVCRALGLSRAACLQINRGARWVRGGAGHGIDSALLRAVSEPFESSAWIEDCVISRRPGFVRNAAQASALPLKYVELFELGPLLCVPIVDSGGPVTVILLDRRGAPFTASEDLLRAAASVGSSLGLALEAAKSYAGLAPGNEPALVLSSRQRQMLSLLSRGMSNKEIATATGLSVFTVRDYVSSLLRSLEVESRSAAVARAWELGLLGADTPFGERRWCEGCPGSAALQMSDSQSGGCALGSGGETAVRPIGASVSA